MAGTGPGSPPVRPPSPGMRIARPFGIPVYVSPYWFVVACILVVFYGGELGSAISSAPLRYIVASAFVVLLYGSVLAHELSHSVVARLFGLPVRRILLYPLGGFSEIEVEPPTPAREFLISAAGPAMSIVLAAAGYAAYEVARPRGAPAVLLEELVFANVLVSLLNLLPGLPLDGGRMLRAVVWKLTGRPGSATVAAAWVGRALAAAAIGGVLVYLSVTRTPQLFDVVWVAIIAVFMWSASGQSIRATRVRERLPAIQARLLARRAIPIPASLPLAEAIRRADAAQARALVVVDHDDKPIAIVNEAAVMATPPQRRPWVDAGSLARSIDPSLILNADLSGMALLDAVRRSPATEYLLVEPSGQVFGVLATADLDTAFAQT